MVAGGSDLAARLFRARTQPFGFARLGLQVVAQAAGGGHLVLPGHVERVAVLAEELLFGFTLVGAGHVRGGDGHEVTGRADLGHGRGDA